MRTYDIFDCRKSSGFIVRRVPFAWLARSICLAAFKCNRVVWDYDISA